MAARNLARTVASLDRDVVILCGGGTGAGGANLTDIRGPGIASVVHSATGTYTVNLTDAWQNILFVTGEVMDSAISASDDWKVNITGKSASAKTINITVTKNGTDTNLTTDEKLMLLIIVNNSNVPVGATRP